MKFGEHRGGMFIDVKGTRNGVEVVRSWHLLAEGDDGPYIPSMAIEGVLRKYLRDEPPETGARPATNALSLADYGELFKTKAIYTGFRNSPRQDAPIFEKILGEDFPNLPTTLREFHGVSKERVWSGRTQVQRGRNPLALLLGKLIGFPAASDDVPVSVSVRQEKGGERWTRDFNGTKFTSLLQPGRGRNDRLITERFGPITIALALVRKEDRLHFVPRRWNLLGVPLPALLMPGGESFEMEQDGRFNFDVEIRVPLLGLLASYRGWLEA